MEELQRVARAEPERSRRPMECSGAVAVAGERPPEDVVAEDARTLGVTAAREYQRVWKVDSVVDVEQRDVEVVAHAVCGEQALDDGDELVLTLRLDLRTEGVVEIAEETDVLRQRHVGD